MNNANKYSKGVKLIKDYIFATPKIKQKNMKDSKTK